MEQESSRVAQIIASAKEQYEVEVERQKSEYGAYRGVSFQSYIRHVLEENGLDPDETQEQMDVAVDSPS